MNSITLADITAWIALLIPIGGCIAAMFKLWHRFDKLERQAAYRQEDTAMIFEALRGCLEGLIQSGANGSTTAALKRLNTYTDNKAAGLTGDGKHRKS